VTHGQKVAYLADAGWGFRIRDHRYLWTDPKDPTRVACDTATALARQKGRDVVAEIRAKESERR
jgi:hypothetical protein